MKKTAEGASRFWICMLAAVMTFVSLIPASGASPKINITDKTLVVWVSPVNLTQQGGSALTVNDTSIDRFDGVVFAELEPSVWMPGSNNYGRSVKDQSAWPKEIATPDQFVQMAIVYKGKKVTVYRNGKLYAEYIMPGEPYTFGARTAILFGPRHLGNNDYFFGRIKDARVYARPLDQATIAAMEPGKPVKDVEPWAWRDFASTGTYDKAGHFNKVKLSSDTKIEDGCLVLGGTRPAMLATIDSDNIPGNTDIPTQWSTSDPTVPASTSLLHEKSARSRADDGVFRQSIAYIPIDQSGDLEVSLNGEWRFMLNGPEEEFFKPDFDVSGWSTIKVPGNWEVQDFEEPLYKEPREGVGLYRRIFEVPAVWKDRRVFIRFEGVLYGFEFWVNGKRAGRFESAFNRSEFDITGLIEREKSNVLAVRVYRRFKGWQFDTHDAWAISGIYRDVSLFPVVDGHIKDLTVITEVKQDFSSASVQCKVTVARSSAETADFTVSSTLIEPGGRTVDRSKSTGNMRHRKKGVVCVTLHVDNPLLWNAETPNLYDLQLDLRFGSDILHSVIRKVGIRQVSIDGDVFKLNYRPIKLRGVNHHDIHPDVGRALREEHYREDIELMKKANINAVRTSHYPPHPIFLDLCDRYGMYVICEVPFGFGDKNLKDQSYGDILLTRAEATVARDKNHPSVLIWSVGNENPITPIVVNAADRVKELDPTRFRLLPGAQDSEGKTPAKGENLTEFAEKTKFIFNLPESVEIAAPHYPYVVEVPERDRKINLTDLALDKSIQRPVICTEYNHSLSSAFEGLKEHWEMIETYDRLCGAFIWNWSDQGLRRKITGREILTDTAKRLTISSKESTVCADVWLDAETVLDSHGGSGSDGIVYADSFPQVDYWITRKVYSQVVIPESRAVVHQGKQKIELTVLNRYDFTNLDKLKGTWELLRDGKRMTSGDILVSAPPHGKDMIAIELDLKDDIETTENLLRIVFADFYGRQIYERSVHLVPESGKVDFAQRLSVNAPVTPLQPAVKREGISSYQFRNLVVRMNHVNGKVKLLHADSGTSLLEGPIVRVGRTPVMAEWRNYPRYNIKFWENPLLQNRKVIESTSSLTSGGGVELKMKLNYPSLDKNREGESILVDLRFHVSPQGWIDVDYELTPQNATGNFLDFGLAFKLPGAMKHLTWIGDGPYNSYPGQTDAVERGIWHIAPRPVTYPESRYYEGNRANVDLAAVTDGKGNGIGVICDGSTVSLEEREGQQIFSQVLRSSGKGNKTGGMMTLLPVKAAEVKSEKGTLRFVPLEDGKWPALFEELCVFE